MSKSIVQEQDPSSSARRGVWRRARRMGAVYALTVSLLAGAVPALLGNPTGVPSAEPAASLPDTSAVETSPAGVVDLDDSVEVSHRHPVIYGMRCGWGFFKPLLRLLTTRRISYAGYITAFKKCHRYLMQVIRH